MKCYPFVTLFIVLSLLWGSGPTVGLSASRGVATSPVQGTDGDWHIETVDSGYPSTGASALTLDEDGNPHIAYSSGSGLQYARWDTGAGAWQIESLDNISGGASLALDEAGNPHIGYIRPENWDSDLKYAHRSAGASDWRIEIVDSAELTGLNPDVAVDTAGNPHISYHEWNSSDLRYAHWDSDIGTWQLETVDSVGVVGQWTSIVVDDLGNPHIAYYDQTNHDPKYAYWDGSAWQIETVSDEGSVVGISLAMDGSGTPHISYLDAVNDELKYAYRNMDTGIWQVEAVGPAYDGSNTSLVLDEAGHPHISYILSGVRYAYWDADVSAWQIETVDSGGQSALALDSTGNPHIVYSSSGDLKYAWKGGGSSALYSISGYVRDGSGNPISGVTVSTGAGGSATTDASGDYIITGVMTSTYTLTPSKSDYTFSPSTRTVSVPPDATGQDFTGTAPSSTYSISGHVRDGSGDPVSGVIVSTGATGNATTNADGYYTLSGINAGAYTLTPNKSGYTFSPSTRTVSVPPNWKGQDFTGTLADLWVNHIQVVQVLLADTDPANNQPVPLIAEKLTLVRVHVGVGGAVSIPNVTASLYVQDAQGQVHEVNPNYKTGQYITAKTNPDPHNINDTVNFLPHVDWLQGDVTFWAEIDPGNRLVESSESNNAGGIVTEVFQPAQTLTVSYVPIRYKPPLLSGCRHGEPTDRIRTAYAWAQRAYPTARIELIELPPMDFNEPLKTWPCGFFSEDQNTDELFNDLLKWNELTNNQSTYVFGWLPEGAYRGGLARVYADKDGSFLGGQVAFGDDHLGDGQRIFAHEVAHLLGRPHTKAGSQYCGNPSPAIWSDWPSSYPDAKIQTWGIDIVSGLKDPKSTYDYMSYCWGESYGGYSAWTSPWTYNHIYSETLGIHAASLTAGRLLTPQPYFIASGLAYTDDTATLAPVWVITKTTSVNNPPVGTGYCLEAQNAFSTPLTSHCFDLTFLDHQTGKPKGMDGFHLILPYSSDIVRIVLKKGSQELAVRQASDNAPVVTVLSPNGGENWLTGDVYTVTWTAGDTDGDLLTYGVLYSPDGTNWVPVGMDISETQLVINTAELAGGSGAKVRVLTSDGMNNSSDESDAPFTVGRKGPQAYILSPEEDTTVQPGSVLFLQGYAYDLEDGALDEAALRWSSNRDGDLGTGGQALVALSQGQHIIMLTAADSDDNTSATTINVFVGYKTYLPLILK